MEIWLIILTDVKKRTTAVLSFVQISATVKELLSYHLPRSTRESHYPMLKQIERIGDFHALLYCVRWNISFRFTVLQTNNQYSSSCPSVSCCLFVIRSIICVYRSSWCSIRFPDKAWGVSGSWAYPAQSGHEEHYQASSEEEGDYLDQTTSVSVFTNYQIPTNCQIYSLDFVTFYYKSMHRSQFFKLLYPWRYKTLYK
mgnify:CR=1 FL=1